MTSSASLQKSKDLVTVIQVVLQSKDWAGQAGRGAQNPDRDQRQVKTELVMADR